jgi:phenolic acid decarboxylase
VGFNFEIFNMQWILIMKEHFMSHMCKWLVYLYCYTIEHFNFMDQVGSSHELFPSWHSSLVLHKFDLIVFEGVSNHDVILLAMYEALIEHKLICIGLRKSKLMDKILTID